MRMRTIVIAVIGALGLMACGDDDPSPGAPTPVTPAQPTVSSLSIRSDGETTLSVGSTLTVTACAHLSDGSENCAIQASWQSLQPEVASVENGVVTARAAGQATIQASYQGRTATLQITVEAAEPTLTFAFDPAPPATIAAGDTGHFRVNVTTDGSRRRLTDGVTSSAESVVRLGLEGDRWRYTGVSAGSAEIRVVHDGRRRLTHAMTVQAPPEPDYEIANVTRYDTSIHVADWLYFTWRARMAASRFTVNVKFQQGEFFTSCTERWYDPEAGEQERELSIPSVCGSDEQWSTVTIEPADGRTCRGCGTFRRTDLPHGRNLGPAGEANAVREERARRD